MSITIEPQAIQTDPSAVRACDAAVIIPVYNRATVVRATLESVARQTVKPARLIVVDDGSTDDTVAAVEAWIDEACLPFEARVLRCPHESAAAARNAGFAEVGDARWTAFLDSDDCWPEDFLERTSAILEHDETAVAVSADRQFVDAEGRNIQFDDCRPLAEDAVAWFFGHGAGVASSTLLQTAAVRKAGKWRTAFDSGEDAMIFTLVAVEGAWRHAPGAPVVFHHGNASDRREEGNLSKRYADAYRRWAATYEKVYDAIEGRYPAGRMKQLRHGVAGYWYRAGKQLEALGLPGEAQKCFARAVRWRPLMVRAWCRRRFAA